MSEDTMHPVIEDMFKSGVHYGYSKTRRHPSVSKFIFTTKNRVDIIDIEKSANLLAEAKKVVTELVSKGKTILFVGVKPEAKGVVKATAESLGMPYVSERWVGGILTNWSEIKKRIARLEDLKEKKEKGELEKYTKKERSLFDEEIAKMHKLFSGLVIMKKLPDALCVIDPKREHIAVTEAKKMHLPVIGLLNTDSNMASVDYPVLGNDSSVSSITFFMKAIEDASRGGIVESK